MAHDVVYLKNGSIIKGKVIEVVPSESVKVQTQDGSLFVYSMDEIDRISNEENADNTESYLKRGFRGIPDLSIHAGLNDGSNIMFMASYTDLARPSDECCQFLNDARSLGLNTAFLV